MSTGIFDGKYCYFLKRADGYEWTSIGTCNADDHWKALEKFENGLGCNPMERGKVYRIERDAGRGGNLVKMKFVY